MSLRRCAPSCSCWCAVALSPPYPQYLVMFTEPPHVRVSCAGGHHGQELLASEQPRLHPQLLQGPHDALRPQGQGLSPVDPRRRPGLRPPALVALPHTQAKEGSQRQPSNARHTSSPTDDSTSVACLVVVVVVVCRRSKLVQGPEPAPGASTGYLSPLQYSGCALQVLTFVVSLLIIIVGGIASVRSAHQYRALRAHAQGRAAAPILHWYDVQTISLRGWAILFTCSYELRMTDKVYPKAGDSHRKGLVVSGFVETGTLIPPSTPNLRRSTYFCQHCQRAGILSKGSKLFLWPADSTFTSQFWVFSMHFNRRFGSLSLLTLASQRS